jgi:small subunit ribosomal protein S9
MVTKKPTTEPKPAEKKPVVKKPAAAKKPVAEKKPAAPRKKKAVVEAAPVAPQAVVPAVVEAPAAPVAKAEAPEAAVPAKKDYIYALGRRKRAIAQVRMYVGGKGEITVNGKKFVEYFNNVDLRQAVMEPLKAVGQDDKVNLIIISYGGGMAGQADAARLGISRALVKLNETFRTTLKKMGMMMRDPREKERKKYGLKKARKGPQWAKR